MDISALSSTYAQAARGSLTAAGFAAVQNGDDAELKAACVEFEAYFINAMFKEMRKTAFAGDKSFAETTYREMADDELAKQLAASGGVGLAAFMYQQMKKDAPAPALAAAE